MRAANGMRRNVFPPIAPNVRGSGEKIMGNGWARPALVVALLCGFALGADAPKPVKSAANHLNLDMVT
jgi:hypothetical protein